MKKAVFIIDNLSGGGAEKAIKLVTEQLSFGSELDAQLLLLEDKKDYEVSENLKCSALVDNFGIIQLLPVFFKLIAYFRRERPDYVVCTNTKSQILVLLTGLFLKIKIFVNIQNNLLVLYAKRRFLLNILLFLYKRADGFLMITQGLKEAFDDIVADKPCAVINNPVSFDEVTAQSSQNIPSEYEYIFSKKVVINVGRLNEQKAQHVLIEAFAKSGLNDWNLVILGRGNLENELKELCRKLNIAERVFFLGFQSNPFSFLKRAQLFALSSEWEGFGNVIVEAMACGLPVLTTNCPYGPEEILQSELGENSSDDNGAGVLVPVGDVDVFSDGLTRLGGDHELCQALINRSLKRCSDFSSEQIASQYIDTLK